MSTDGMTVAVDAPENDDNGSRSGHARVFACSSTTNAWNDLGNTVVGAASGDDFGTSVSMSADGVTVAVGAPHDDDDDDGGCIGCARVFTYSSTTKKWNALGDALVGAVPDDRCGWLVSMSADGVAVAVGAPFDDDNGCGASHARVFTYCSTAKKWNRLCNILVGVASGDVFGFSASMPADGATVVVGACANDDDGTNAGHVRVFTYSPTANKWNQLGSTLVGAASHDYLNAQSLCLLLSQLSQ